MDTVVSVLLLGGLGLFLYKYRAEIKKWLSDPVEGHTYVIPRKLRLERRIEDSQAELDWLEAKEEK